MIIVKDIFSACQDVLGTCDEATTFAKLNEAVTILRESGRWDPNEGIMDICTNLHTVTLPDDVEVPLAINIGGVPCSFRNKWFEFNLNGPGSDCCDELTYSWADDGFFPTFRTPHGAAQLVAYPDLNEGNDCSIRVFGYDENDKWIMTPDNTGTLVDGFLVPVLYGSGILSNQKIKRITRVLKPVTRGFVKLVAIDPNDPNGVLLGYYLPSDTNPQYRRITLSGSGCNRFKECNVLNNWVRMRYRRKGFILNNQEDLIFLNSPTAIKMACMAIKFYEANLFADFRTAMAEAVGTLQRNQKAISGPNQIRIQFDRGSWASDIGSNMA